MLVRSQPERRRAPRVRGAHSAAAYFRQPAPAGRSLPRLWGRCWLMARVCGIMPQAWQLSASHSPSADAHPPKEPLSHHDLSHLPALSARFSPVRFPPQPAPNASLLGMQTSSNPTGVTGRLRNWGTCQAAAAHQAGTAMVGTHCSPGRPSPHPFLAMLPCSPFALQLPTKTEATRFARVPALPSLHRSSGIMARARLCPEHHWTRRRGGRFPSSLRSITERSAACPARGARATAAGCCL